MKDEELKNIIATNIRIFRAKEHWSQEKLATMCESTQQHINNIENGKVLPSIVMLIKFAKAFDIDINKLINKNV